jgi:AAA family ATP:ADP antiporter
MLDTYQNLSSLRKLIWPISKEESKKFVAFGLMIMMLVLNYTILRNLKDSLIFTAPGSGPEVVSFVKGWLVMPSSFLFVIIYTKISNLFSQEKVFYYITLFFLGFFGFFTLVLYPFIETLHPSYEFIKYLQETYPRFQWLFPVYGIWMYTLFYIFSELWGSVMVAFLFWQFANSVIEGEQAKRFYPMFNLFSNIGLIGSSFIVHWITSKSGVVKNNPVEWEGMIFSFGIIIISAGFVSMMLFRYLNHFILPQENQKYIQEKKQKLKLSLKESFSYILSSSYLGLIAIIVLGYNITLNLVEVIWKKQLTLQFPNPMEYSSFMGKFYGVMGVSAILIVLITKNVMSRFGWLYGAIITPLSYYYPA